MDFINTKARRFAIKTKLNEWGLTFAEVEIQQNLKPGTLSKHLVRDCVPPDTIKALNRQWGREMINERGELNG